MILLLIVGTTIWIDEAQLQVGDSLLVSLMTAIEKADFFVVLLSSNSVGSRWVQEELAYAMTLHINGKEKFILPLVLDECKIPGFIQTKLYLDFSKKKYSFKQNIQRLIQTIDASYQLTPVSGKKSPLFLLLICWKMICQKLSKASGRNGCISKLSQLSLRGWYLMLPPKQELVSPLRFFTFWSQDLG